MFGYVTPQKPELRVRELAFYKAVYCGLCRCIGKQVSQTARLSLSYDFVFLALLRASLSGEHFSVTPKRCFLHPLKKRPVADANPSLDYAARAGALMTYYKLLDETQDQKGIKRLFAALLLYPARRFRKKAALPELEKKADPLLSSLRELEIAVCPSPDRAAQCFGQLLSDVFAEGLPPECREERIARVCGLAAGRWIYLIDAVDDYGKDLKSGSYNPVLAEWQSEHPDAVPPSSFRELPEDTRERWRVSLTMELSRLAGAFDLIDCPDRDIRALLENIIHLGMVARQNTLFDD